MTKKVFKANLEEALESKDLYFEDTIINEFINLNYEECQDWTYEDFESLASEICAQWNDFWEGARQMGCNYPLVEVSYSYLEQWANDCANGTATPPVDFEEFTECCEEDGYDIITEENYETFKQLLDEAVEFDEDYERSYGPQKKITQEVLEKIANDYDCDVEDLDDLTIREIEEFLGEEEGALDKYILEEKDYV